MEMVMKLEASPLAETSTGMTNLQNQLANLTIQMHELKKGKEVVQDIWCIIVNHKAILKIIVQSL